MPPLRREFGRPGVPFWHQRRVRVLHLTAFLVVEPDHQDVQHGLPHVLGGSLGEARRRHGLIVDDVFEQQQVWSRLLVVTRVN